MAAQHAQDNSHNPTVQDVEDESDLGHPHTLIDEPQQPPSNGPSPPLTSQAKGKEKASTTTSEPRANGKAQTKPLNTESEEAFPSLGPKRGDPLAGATAWGAKPASVSTAARTSAPRAGAPLNMPRKGARHSITIQKEEFKPSSELRKPIAEIIRNHNKRSKAPVTSQSTAMSTIFHAEGPTMDLVNQSLKEIANEVCAKVCLTVVYVRYGY